MKERKVVKIRVDMYEDTKFKIIDTMEERDFIHYIWVRLIALAGKVNLEGNLYLSRNMPYTLETLSIEFNRNIDQVKLALKVLIDLEMMHFTEDKVYVVKNFVKHQNIKLKEKVESKLNMIEEKNIEEKNIDNKLYEEKYQSLGEGIEENIVEVPGKKVFKYNRNNNKNSKEEKIKNDFESRTLSDKNKIQHKLKRNLEVPIALSLGFLEGEMPQPEGEEIILSCTF